MVSQALWSRESAFLDLLGMGPAQLRAAKSGREGDKPAEKNHPFQPLPPHIPPSILSFHELQHVRSSWKP